MTNCANLVAEMARWCHEHIAFMAKEGLTLEDFHPEDIVDGAVEDSKLWEAFTACAAEAILGSLENDHELPAALANAFIQHGEVTRRMYDDHNEGDDLSAWATGTVFEDILLDDEKVMEALGYALIDGVKA